MRERSGLQFSIQERAEVGDSRVAAAGLLVTLMFLMDGASSSDSDSTRVFWGNWFLGTIH